ncbi:MAG: DUF4317 domain-containing protein [Lachnospiraceae bacterium]|nr:DUF4317 domain-containing protein [Lachnospiraceae bacterium]
MQRKDLLELKKRFKKDECTFTRMSGCYVNSQKEKVVTLNEVFLNLPDEEYYKYLEIAKKSLSGTLGNNLLELEFPMEEEQAGGKQQFFMGLKASALKDEGLLDRFYDLIIDTYDYVGNYLILLYHDAYDVMVKTEDNRKLDESEEVYEYLLCAICPVTLSKPGLGYLEEENKIGVRLRDWIVSPPENGFLFPAFTQRSSDIHALVYYTKNAKEPHKSFMEEGLGCGSKRTALQQKKSFQDIVKKAVAEIPDDEILADDVFITLQESISDLLDREQPETPDAEPITLTADTFKTIIEECDFSEELAPKLEKAFAEEFAEELPTADAVLDAKALAKNEQKKKEKELISEVATLKESLAKVQDNDGKTSYVDPDTGEILSSDDETPKLCDVFVRMKPDRASLVTTQMIDGQKCLVIPVEAGDDIDINGIKME